MLRHAAPTGIGAVRHIVEQIAYLVILQLLVELLISPEPSEEWENTPNNN